MMSVRPGVRPSDSPTVRPSVRVSVRPFSTLQHALTYWAEILHMFLFYCITDQVRVSLICVNFVGVMPLFGTYNIGNAQFSGFFFSYMLWHIELTFCIWLCFTVLQIKFKCRQFASIFVGVLLFWNLEYWKYAVFSHFSSTCFDILLKFYIWLSFNELQIKFECHAFAPIL